MRESGIPVSPGSAGRDFTKWAIDMKYPTTVLGILAETAHWLRVMPGGLEMCFAIPVLIVCFTLLERGGDPWGLVAPAIILCATMTVAAGCGAVRAIFWRTPPRPSTFQYGHRLGNWLFGEKEFKDLQIFVYKYLNWILFAPFAVGAVSFFVWLMQLVAIILRAQASE